MVRKLIYSGLTIFSCKCLMKHRAEDGIVPVYDGRSLAAKVILYSGKTIVF